MVEQALPGPGLRPALPLLVAGFVIMFFVVGGGIDTVSVFLNALATAEGWSRRSLSAGISVGVLCAGLSTPVVGILVDRWGVRVPMTLGTALLALGFGALVAMSEPWHFAAANVFLGAGFASCAMLPITIAVTVRVPDRTALALGIVGVGASAGALVLAPAIQSVVDALGWRFAYLMMGSAVVLTPVPFLLFSLPRGRLQREGSATDAAGRRRLDLRRELRRPGLAPLTGILILPGLATFGIQVHLVPYLSDLGHATTFAAGALGASVGISALGKLGGGLIGDRIGALPALRLALLLEVAAVAFLALAASPLLVALFVAAHGIAVGAQIAVVPVIALSVLGRERFATLFGMLQLAATLTIGLAPIVPGVIVDATGRYAGAVLFWGGAMLLALWVAVRMRIPASGRAGV
jgi:MFS family permease